MADKESARTQNALVIHNPLADASAMQNRVEDTATEPMESTTFVDSLRKKSVDELTAMAKEEREALLVSHRKTAIHAFRFGAILDRIKTKQKQAKNWSQWLIANNVNHGTALRFIALFEGAKNESRLKG